MPDAIWAQIVQIQHDGGVARLNERMNSVQENGKMSWDMLEDIKSLLKVGTGIISSYYLFLSIVQYSVSH